MSTPPPSPVTSDELLRRVAESVRAACAELAGNDARRGWRLAAIVRQVNLNTIIARVKRESAPADEQRELVDRRIHTVRAASMEYEEIVKRWEAAGAPPRKETRVAGLREALALAEDDNCGSLARVRSKIRATIKESEEQPAESAPTQGGCPICCFCSYCETVRERDREALRKEGREAGHIEGLDEAVDLVFSVACPELEENSPGWAYETHTKRAVAGAIRAARDARAKAGA